MSALKLAIASLAICLPASLPAAPTLTTIQDVIYNADGTPYNGFAVINWTPFTAGGSSQIGTQSVTVNIVNGNLYVQLVPTTNSTPAGYYTVTFNSGGNNQFTEMWAVPPSTQPLHIAEVLITSPPGTSPLSGGTPIPESSVTGLLADLAVRPMEGTAWSTGRVAFIDSSGALDAVTGNVSDCLHVDGSSGPCGTSGTAGPSFTDAEVPSGAVDGANTTFTISQVPTPSSSLSLYRNGVLQKAGLDYTLAGNTVQFQAASTPQPGDTLLASYRVTPSGSPQGPLAPQILCAGMGSATSSASITTLGTCTIPAGTIQPGDRVKISFDYSHEGTLAGFAFTVNWGNTVLVSRSANASETFITGRAEAGVGSSAAQVSVQTWGASMNLAATVLNAYDLLSFPLTLSFQGQMAAATTDTLTLRNFTAERLPATQ